MMEFELPHEKGGRRTRQRMLVHRLWSASTTTPQARAQGQGFISSTSTDTDTQLQIIPSHVNSTPSDIKVSPEGPIVPVITVGHVFSSIPKGRTPLSPKTLEAATFLGLEPLLAAATGLSDGYTEEFIDIASHTDPFNAVNILHSEKVLGRRVLFVEKGAAIQLVSGKGNILQAQETLDRLPKSIQGFISLFGNRSPSSATNGLPDDPPTTCGVPSVLTMRKGTRPKPSNPLSVPTNTEEEPFRRGQHKEWERYGVPHLAKLPVRLALSLLCGLPERFLFLGQKGEEEEKK